MPACPACPVAPADGTGACPVAPADGTGVGPADRTGMVIFFACPSGAQTLWIGGLILNENPH